MPSITRYMKLIKETYSKLNASTDFNIKQSNGPISKDTLQFLEKEMLHSTYTLPIDIIKAFLNDSTTCHVTLASDRIILNCVSPTKDLPPIMLLQKIIKRCTCLLKMFNINKQYTLWLLPINYTRYFPNGDMVSPIHINGGYTYQTGTTIFVYRFEECAKVFLHEVLHHSPFDTHNKWTNNQIDDIKTTCSIHNDVILNVNEAIIEFWAVLFQSCFISFEYGIPFQRLIEKEQEWSLVQSKKLLYYQKKHYPQWKENTNSYCYIVFKTILLLNYDTFLKLPVPYSTQSLTDFIKIYSQKLFDSIPRKEIINNSISMRMTLFGDI